MRYPSIQISLSFVLKEETGRRLHLLPGHSENQIVSYRQHRYPTWLHQTRGSQEFIYLQRRAARRENGTSSSSLIRGRSSVRPNHWSHKEGDWPSGRNPKAAQASAFRPCRLSVPFSAEPFPVLGKRQIRRSLCIVDLEIFPKTRPPREMPQK